MFYGLNNLHVFLFLYPPSEFNGCYIGFVIPFVLLNVYTLGSSDTLNQSKYVYVSSCQLEVALGWRDISLGDLICHKYFLCIGLILELS